MTTSWNMHAHRVDGRYEHCGDLRSVQHRRLCAPIVQVEVTEDPDGPYYGYIRTGSTTPIMIQSRWSAFQMQFTYNVEPEVETGQGRVVRLQVREISPA